MAVVVLVDDLKEAADRPNLLGEEVAQLLVLRVADLLLLNDGFHDLISFPSRGCHRAIRGGRASRHRPNRFRTKSANEVYQNREGCLGDACVKSDGIGPESLPDAQQDDIAAAP